MKRNIAVSEELETAGNDFVKYATDLNLLVNQIKDRVQNIMETLDGSVRMADYGFYLNTLQNANDLAELLDKNGEKLLGMAEEALIREHFPTAFRRKTRELQHAECQGNQHDFKLEICDDAMRYRCVNCGKEKKLVLFSPEDI